MYFNYLKNILLLVKRNFVSINWSIILWDIAIFPSLFIFIGGFSFLSFFEESLFITDKVFISYPEYLVSGFVSINIMIISSIIGSIIYNDRRNGMFDQILVMPFTRFQYILSNILTIIIMGLLGASIIFIMGIPILINEINLTILSFFYIIFALIICSIFFGTIVTILMISIEKIETLSFKLESGFVNSLFVFLSLASTVFYPSSIIPQPIQTIVSLNPLTYITGIIRDSSFSQFNNDINIILLILTAMTIVILIFAFLIINKIKL